MNGYCIFAQYCYYEYTCLHSSTCVAPARDSPLFSNEPIFPQTFGEDFASPPSRASILRRWMLHHRLHRREHQSFEDGCCTIYCCEPAGEATRKRLFRIDRDSVYSRGGAPDCMIFTSPDCILERDTRPKDQGLKKDFGDTTVQDCSTPQQQRPPARSKRCLVTDGTSTPIKCAWNGPLATVLRYEEGPSQEEAAAGRVCFRGTKIFLEHFLPLISRGEVKSEFVSASFSPY